MLVLHIFTWCYTINVVRCPNERRIYCEIRMAPVWTYQKQISPRHLKNDRLCESGRFGILIPMRYSANCDVCPIVQAPGSAQGRLDIITGEFWIANLRADDQSLLGTTYVTLKEHKESLADLTPEEDDEFIDIRNDLIQAQMRAFGAEVVNVSCLMNNTFQDEMPAPHVHYHFKPRYSQPVEFRGKTFTDPQFGYYLIEKNRKPVSNNFGRHIVRALQRQLS